MVALEIIKSSNAKLPSHLTAVFVGGTSGIGEYTLKAFATRCQFPKAYFIGRSQEAADRISSELKTLNPAGQYTFLKTDVSLLKSVDKVCEDIRAKEKFINILTISTGTFVTGVETEEGLHLPASILFHSRARLILNLLPLLQAAPTLRRVENVFTGTKEGPIVNEDLQVRSFRGNPLKMRGQAASTVTLSLEQIAKSAPDVSFIHDFPGPVRSNIARGGGIVNLMMRTVARIVGPFTFIPDEESGERHLYLATSSQYPAKTPIADGVALESGISIASGTDGKAGSGVYVADEKCDEGKASVIDVLAKLRAEGRVKYVWDHIEGEFMRITGKKSIDE